MYQVIDTYLCPKCGGSDITVTDGDCRCDDPDCKHAFHIEDADLKESVNEDDEIREVLTDLKILVVGDNHCWGKGDTIDQALKLAFNPKKYVAYVVKANTQVHEVDGSLIHERGFQPKLILRKGVK